MRSTQLRRILLSCVNSMSNQPFPHPAFQQRRQSVYLSRYRLSLMAHLPQFAAVTAGRQLPSSRLFQAHNSSSTTSTFGWFLFSIHNPSIYLVAHPLLSVTAASGPHYGTRGHGPPIVVASGDLVPQQPVVLHITTHPLSSAPYPTFGPSSPHPIAGRATTSVAPGAPMSTSESEHAESLSRLYVSSGLPRHRLQRPLSTRLEPISTLALCLASISSMVISFAG
jgi:hypothetical protein